MKASRDHNQTIQRLKVGMIGLAAVVLLIGLASAIIGSAIRTPAAGGNAAGEVATNVDAANASAGEPLAELGAAPGGLNDQAPATR